MKTYQHLCVWSILSVFFACTSQPQDEGKLKRQMQNGEIEANIEAENGAPSALSQWHFYKKGKQVMGKNLLTHAEKMIVEDVHQEDENGLSEQSYKILSFVGPYLSLEYSYYDEGGAHPSYGTSFQVIHADTGEKVLLTDLFAEEVIFQALMNDQVIQNALSSAHPPQNLKDLFTSADGGCEMHIGENMLASFAFHHLRGNQVAVRIGLSHGCEVSRGNFTQLGMYLPVPAHLAAPLATADAEQTLMQHLNINPEEAISKIKDRFQYITTHQEKFVIREVSYEDERYGGKVLAYYDGEELVKLRHDIFNDHGPYYSIYYYQQEAPVFIFSYSEYISMSAQPDHQVKEERIYLLYHQVVRKLKKEKTFKHHELIDMSKVANHDVTHEVSDVHASAQTYLSQSAEAMDLLQHNIQNAKEYRVNFSIEPSSYYLPEKDLNTGNIRFDRLFIGAPFEIQSYLNGDEEHMPVYLAFDDTGSLAKENDLGQTYYAVSYRIYPDQLRFSDQKFMLSAFHDVLGTVELEGSLNAQSFSGNLTVGSKLFENIQLAGWEGD